MTHLNSAGMALSGETSGAPALSSQGTASPVLRTEPQARLGPSGRVPTGAANDPFEMAWPALCRFNEAQREIRARYAAARLKLASDEQGELDEASRKFWAGEH